MRWNLGACVLFGTIPGGHVWGPDAEEYRKRAEEFYRRAREATNGDEVLVHTLRAIELEAMADELERGQVQQHGTQPPAAPPREQPVQQQQQVQQPKKDEGIGELV